MPFLINSWATMLYLYKTEDCSMKIFIEFKVFFSLSIVATLPVRCLLLCLDLKKHCAEEHKLGDFTIIMFYAGHC
jgi:hypothetical protein